MFHYFFPRHCSLCKHLINVDALLCSHCLDELPIYQELVFRKKKLVCHAGFHYSGHIKTLITDLKFRHKLSYSKLLGNLVQQRMQQHYQKYFPKYIMPVPLHKKRLQERGFNQALEIAKIIAKKNHLKIDTRSLCRQKATEPQAQLSAALRRDNIKNAFALKRGICRDHIILFDDVITTGGTISECVKVLEQTAIAQIDIWCVAKA